jgi:hypothetical protein
MIPFLNFASISYKIAQRGQMGVIMKADVTALGLVDLVNYGLHNIHTNTNFLPSLRTTVVTRMGNLGLGATRRILFIAGIFVKFLCAVQCFSSMIGL